MQSIHLSRSLFGSIRISLIGAALLVGTLFLAVNGTAQQTGNFQQPDSTPESPGIAEHASDSIKAQVDSVRSTVVGNLKVVYFRLAYIQQTLGVLQKSDLLLNQVRDASEARYRVGQGNQQDVLKAQLQHTKILQEIAHHH